MTAGGVSGAAADPDASPSAWTDAPVIAARRNEKWAMMLRAWPGGVSSSSSSSRVNDVVKKRARKGVPLSLRAAVWLRLATGREDGLSEGSALFSDLLAGAIPPESEGGSTPRTAVDPVLLAALSAGNARAPVDGAASPVEVRPPVAPDVLAAVARDIARTFPRHALFVTRRGEHGDDDSASSRCGSSFTSPGQAALARMLVAYARGDPRVGYCQGLNFIAALLLLVSTGTSSIPLVSSDGPQPEVTDCSMWVTPAAEAAAFAMLWAVMAPARAASKAANESSARAADAAPPPPSMAVLFLPGLPRLTALLHVLSGLVNARLPALAAAFSAHGVVPSMWATQWLMTVFSYSLPLAAVVRIWDSFLAEGWKVPLRAALALLVAHERELLAAAAERGFEGLLMTLQSIPSRPPATTPARLMLDAFALKHFPWGKCADLLTEEAWLRETGRDADAGGWKAGTFLRAIPAQDLKRLRALIVKEDHEVDGEPAAAGE